MTLDRTQTMIMNRHGYNRSQMIGFKIIYDFISRFAYANEMDGKKYKSIEIKMMQKNGHAVPVPRKTMEIIENIGFERLGMFFSMAAYPKYFENFCKKMFDARAQPKDFISSGLIVIEPLSVQEVEYNMLETA